MLYLNVCYFSLKKKKPKQKPHPQPQTPENKVSARVDSLYLFSCS